MTNAPDLKLLWSQEFDGAAGVEPDDQFWNYQNGDGTEFGIPGWGNQELEFYVPEAVRTDGESNLVISAKRVELNATPISCYYGNAEWVSARLSTQNKVTFQYGRLEARIKVPEGGGVWPALWLLGTDITSAPWPACGEIDLLEARGNFPREVIGTVHGPNYFAENGRGKSLWLDVDLADDFHTFTIDWLEDHITWYFDGDKYHEVFAADVEAHEWVFNHEFYLLLNLAIGGGFAGAVDPALNDATLTVDWIRHFSINGVGSSQIS